MTFAGDKKHGKWLLITYEDKLRDFLVPMVPSWCETYHLTMLTAVWVAFIVGFSFLAKFNIHWLWGVSIMIFLQYISDLLDGSVGRARNTGLIKWGYYMDHFLDYLFLCSILIGYSFLVPHNLKYMLFFVQALLSGFMVNSFLSFAATNKFKISYLGIGPTEIRILFIVINTLLIVFGKTYLAFSLPYVLVFSMFGLFWVVYKTQKEIWEIDMEAKKKNG